MRSKIFPMFALTILALVLATACERGEKGDKDEDEDEKAPAATATSTQPQVSPPAGKAASYNFDNGSPGNLPPNFISARTGGGAR